MKSIAWDIWLYCNYNCKFCNSKTSILPKEIKDLNLIVDIWKKVYDKYGTCKLYITGGEPFLYPNFINIIKKLIKFHNLHITTNLSIDINNLKNINIDKNKIFINATFHPMYQNIYEFIEKILILKNVGYNISATYMSNDLQMAEVLNYKKCFNSNSIDFSIVETDCKEKINNNVKNYFINGLIKYNYMQMHNKEENICNAGYEYLVVDNLGDIYICSRNRNKLGNIFVNGLDFLSQKTKCNKDCVLLEKKYY